MKLIYKYCLIFFFIFLTILAVGYSSVIMGRKILEKSIEESTFIFTQDTLDEVDITIHNKIEIFQDYSRNLTLVEAVAESNRGFDKLENIREYIDEKDREWTSVPKETITPFMRELINNSVADELREKTNFYKQKYGIPIFSEVIVTNKYGANVAITTKTSDYRQDDEEWWQVCKKEGLFVKDIKFDESAGVFSLDLGIRIKDKEGNFIGVIKVIYNTEGLIQELKGIINRSEMVNKYKSGIFTLVDKRGRVIYSTGNYKLSDCITGLIPASHFKEGLPSIEKKTTPRGKILVVHSHSRGSKDFKGIGWISIVEYDVHEIFRPAEKLRDIILFITMIMTFVIIATGFLLSRTLVNPILKLSKATKEIGRGRLDKMVDIKAKDEIGQLADSFNKMILDLRRSNNEIISTKEYSENIIRSLIGALIVVTPEATIKQVNKATCDLSGYREEELLGRSVSLLFADDERSSLKEIGLEDLTKKGSVNNVEKTWIAKDGRKIPMFFSGSVMRDGEGKIQGIVCIAVDITERKQAEKELKIAYKKLKATQKATMNVMMDLDKRRKEIDASLKEKEVLLKEIHHRVKNNMQVIISLLKYQADNLKDEKFIEILKESQNRIKAMALIHEKLYGAKNLSRINFSEYIKNLTNELFRFYKVSKAKIELKIDASDVSLNIDTAIPCGLIINEFVTNSLKYAFPDNKEGEIKICLHLLDKGEIELILSDNGIGISEDIDYRNTESLGLSLIFNLTNHQLEGKIELDRGKGTEFRIRFKEPEYKNRI